MGRFGNWSCCSRASDMIGNCSSRKISDKKDDHCTTASASQNTTEDTLHSGPILALRGRPQKPVSSSGIATRTPSSARGTSLPQFSATCSIDTDWNLTFHSSRSLQSRLNEVFPTSFREKFLKIVVEELSTVERLDIGRQAFDVRNRTPPSCVTEDTSADDNDTLTNLFCSKTKRPRSTSTPCAKRRKHCVCGLDQPLPSSSVVAVKGEEGQDGSDNAEDNDPDELVDTGYLSANIRADDNATLERCIDDRLNHMQQLGCKSVAKPWIKAKEPRKQTRYPYNAGDRKEEAIALFGKENAGELTKPPWWPKTDGWPTKGCRHREPDHLLKSERLILLKHMLRECSVAVLQKSTDPSEIANDLKKETKKDLAEIYKIRRHQERYEKNEIDGDSTVSVTLLVRDGRRMSKEPVSSVSRRREKAERATIRNSPRLLSPSTTGEGSQQDVACDSNTSMKVSNEVFNELGLASGEDMQIPATKPGQDANYPWRTGFSDLGSLGAFLSNSPKGLQLTKFDDIQDDFSFEVTSHDQTYPGDRKAVGKAAGFSSVAPQAHSASYGGIADLPLIDPCKANSAGLGEVPANAGCSRASVTPSGGLLRWSSSCFNEPYNFENASMCTPAIGSINTEFPIQRIKVRSSWHSAS